MEALFGTYQYEPIPRNKNSTFDVNSKPLKKTKVNLQPKHKKITWNTRKIEGFEKRKAEIVRNAELCLPDVAGTWIIEFDVSNCAVCGILKQKRPDGRDMLVAYFSRKLQRSQQGDKFLGQMGWTAREKGTYELVTCLSKFR